MWSFSRVHLVFLLVGVILSSSSNAQPTVDDSSSCQSSTSDEAVSRVRNELQDVKKLLGSVLNLLGSNQQQNGQIKEDLENLKAAYTSNQQQNNASCVSKEDLESLKAAYTSNQQQIKEDLEILKAAYTSNQQQNNESCISKEDLENLKTAYTSNQQQNNASCVSKEDLENLKAAYTSNQQQNNESCISKEDLENLKTAYTSNQQQNNASCISKEDLENFKTACTQQNTSSSCTPVLIQQNIDGSNFFNRSWAEFKVGFGNSSGNFWLGNERLSQLTQQGRYKLRFALQKRGTNSWYWADYSTFTVTDETYNYRLNVSGYRSNTGYDAFGYSNGMMFTTYDRDNDMSLSGFNCAVYNGGGFWYTHCAVCSVNTVRGRGDDFDWYDIKLQTSRMWLTCL